MSSLRETITKEKGEFAFSANYLKDATWDEGLREFFEYRDLGITEATKQQVKAHIIRVKENGDPSSLHTTGLHIHELEFQMIYILKGWIRFIYHLTGEDGRIREEEHKFGPGDCCLQPPKIVHNELECSNDLELLEVTLPAKYRTKVV